MDLLVQNLVAPVVLAFLLGMVARWVRSDLEIPSALYQAMNEVGDTCFENYAVIAWLTSVSVLRGNKFAGGKD